MRVTTNLIYDQNLRAINVSQGQLSDIQTQLASGKKLLRPSDDPVGAAQVVRLTEELDKITQYQRNVDLATNNLELQETSLRSINDVVNRARVLVVQSGNGILSGNDKAAIASEIEQIRNQVIDLMNTQNAAGDYIFAGYQSESQAFEFNPSAQTNVIAFTGDDGTNEIQLSDSVKIRTTTSGKTLFEDVPARLSYSVSATNGATLDANGVSNQGTFDTFHKQNFDPVNALNNQYAFTIVSATQIDVTNVGTGALVESIPFSSGENTQFNGITLNITGVTNDSVVLDLNRPEKKNIAETLHTMMLALQNDGINQQGLASIIDDTLVGIDNAMSTLSRENSSIGARLNIAQAVEDSLLDSQVTNERARSAIEDVDYAQASSDFARQETALEAAFASFPRIANLSLFNFI
ncbi:flagellar hook-associated protein FlgL [Glaciecola sp. XM2]|uniref:flagellar hook-associated protein FlgL n=1 Tax=Glaciecola sp. XM2 TaxID=1914931 RepID=UPI001BDE6BD7|nr:flagellar hook-associated protein FlgL [Glaciecola sp. XM2]MBT1450803.1 flagellar hook-associated protein FlgL [Glaciecola sp. XM2]